MKTTISEDIQKALPCFLMHKTVWSSHDNEADVLYVHFKKPNHADNSAMTEDEITTRYEKKEVVALTILNTSKRVGSTRY